MSTHLGCASVMCWSAVNTRVPAYRVACSHTAARQLVFLPRSMTNRLDCLLDFYSPFIKKGNMKLSPDSDIETIKCTNTWIALKTEGKATVGNSCDTCVLKRDSSCRSSQSLYKLMTLLLGIDVFMN